MEQRHKPNPQAGIVADGPDNVKSLLENSSQRYVNRQLGRAGLPKAFIKKYLEINCLSGRCKTPFP